MLGELTGPETEAVVVFGRQDEALHSRPLGRQNNLVRIEGGRVEDLFILIAIAPFFVGEGVDGEVQESIDLHLMPAQLPLRGPRPVRLRGWNSAVVSND